MKYAFFAALLLVSALFLTTKTTTAEQVEVKPELVTKIYNLAPYFTRSFGFPNPNDDPTEDPDPTKQIALPSEDDALDQVRTLAGWQEGMDDGMAQFVYGFKLVVRNTPAKIRDFDRAIETLFPKPWSHNISLALVAKDGADAPPSIDPRLGFAEGLAFLKGREFKVQWFAQFSLFPGRCIALLNGEDITYVAEQEGLIATFARGFKPVVKTLLQGSLIYMKYHDFEGTTTLNLTVRETRLKEMKTTIQNGNEIQLPVIAYNDWRRQLVFSRPGIQTIGYYFDGTACVLLIELEE